MNEIGETLAAMVAEELAGFTGLELRIQCNRVRSVLDKLDRPGMPAVAMQPMTSGESKAFGEQCLTFGKHAGERYSEAPRDYLDWLVETKRTEWRQLLRYLQSLPKENDGE